MSTKPFRPDFQLICPVLRSGQIISREAIAPETKKPNTTMLPCTWGFYPERKTNMKTYKVGTKAFYDTFSGLVPVKVTAINRPCGGRTVGEAHDIDFVVEKDFGPYKKGESLSAAGHMVLPRSHRKLRGYHYRIDVDYKWDVASTPLEQEK